MSPKPTTQNPEIAPLPGWNNRSKYGTLTTQKKTKLVRLEDVHKWLMDKKSLPSSSIAAQVFGVFVSELNSELGLQQGTKRLRDQLHVIDPSAYPIPANEAAGRSYFRGFAEHLPYLLHHSIERDTPEAFFYALGVLTGELWASDKTDVDLDARLEGFCPDDAFPSIEVCREFVGCLAVPIELAYGLWGWGSVVEVVPLQGVSGTAGNGATPISDTGSKPAANPRTRQHRTIWTDDQRKQLMEDFKATKVKGEQKYIVVGKLWDLGGDAVKKQLGVIKKKAKNAAAMGSVVRSLKASK